MTSSKNKNNISPEKFQKLAQDYDLLKTICDHLDICIWVTEVLPDGQLRWTYNNPKDQKLTGLNLNKPGGIKFTDVMSNEDAKFNEHYCREVLNTGKPLTFEDNFHTENTIKWSLNTLIPVKDNKGKITKIIGSGQDITEEKKYIQQLRFQAQLLDSVREAIIAIDIKGKIIYWSRGAEEMLGYTSIKTIGNDISSFIDLDVFKGYSGLLEIMAQTEIWQGQSLQKAKSGKKIWVESVLSKIYDQNNKLSGFIGIARDITRRKRAEQELKESATRYRQQFENSHAVMLIIDPQTGFILDANPAATNFYGYTKQQLLNMKIQQINIADQDEVKNSMNQARNADRQYFEFKHRLKNGQIKDVEVYSGPVQIDGSVALYSIIHDVTERNKAQQIARIRQEELAHASRLVTVGELTSSLAHEINQPLCAILTHAEGCLSILKKNEPHSNKLKQKIDTVVKQAARCGEIINYIKGFVRKEEPKRKVISLYETLEEVDKFLALEAHQKKISLKTKLPPRKIKIWADPIQIEQVIINLANNGFEAMKNNQKHHRKLFIFTTQLDNDWIEIAVRDLGEGIPQNLEEEILKPFYTTKKGGLGIGLSISHSIIEAHGGKIYARKHHGQGALMAFKLPIHKIG